MNQIDEVMIEDDRLKKLNKQKNIEISEEALTDKINQLLILLENYDASAQDLYDELKGYMVGSSHLNIFNDIGNYINDFDYDLAFKHCRKLSYSFKK